LARGWETPDLPKFVFDRARRTPQLGLILFLGLIFHLRENVIHGQAELFRFPIGWFFRYCGGIPVDRKNPPLVEQMVRHATNRTVHLTIAPKDTSPCDRMEARPFITSPKAQGFHRAGGRDGKHRPFHIMEQVFHPTEDIRNGHESPSGIFWREWWNQSKAKVYT